ncbi:terpene synthase family protein [Micromonospora sp. WMMD961]|uniref:terpene synthase family protein n=1 Tax=Micromonospora sp. WMMD961 TaxID=3016100 RepID=UPI002418038B|nr:terpene synthase family protein [Micromonospora sp. WMMD961]MDG4778605.1 terpene synthase family protein [Micromonospora sp. WMMD961]
MRTGEALQALRAECPVQARLSPHADRVQEWLLGLLPDLGLALDDAALHRLTRGAFARYAGRLYPDASEADLRVLTVLFTWFFLVDDACDGPDRLTSEQIRGLRNGTLTLLSDGPRRRQAGLSGPLRRLLVLAWREPRRRMPARWRSRFADAVARHLDGTWQEAVNKEAGRRPGVDEYVELRRATSAAEVSYALVEFAGERPLPDPVYHHPLLRQIADIGNDLLSWYNDLASLERDRATAGGHNLVLAIEAELAVPSAKAVDLAVERWRESMRQFVALRAAVPSFGPTLDRAVSDHLDVVAYAVRGTIDWTLESARYPISKEGPLANASGIGRGPS